MTLLALVVVAAAVMAAAWALHPGRARAAHAYGEPADKASGFQRFMAHMPNQNGDGNGNGNGTAPTETSLVDSPIVTPGVRDDVALDEQYLQGFDLRSVARFAVRFFTCVLAAMIVATFAVWLVASALGLIGDFERFMEGVGFNDFHLLSIEFLLGVCFIGVAFAIFMTVLVCAAAALYNVLAHRWEGVRVYMSSAPRARVSAALSYQVEEPRPVEPVEATDISPNTMVSSDGDSMLTPPPARKRMRVMPRRRVRP
jgi:hypothetical protein